jgi:hypothetical protein
MQKDVLKKFIKDYVQLFSDDWKYDNKSNFLRLTDDWVQCIIFRSGPMIDNYIIQQTMIYLKLELSAPLQGGYFVEVLHDPYSASNITPWRIKVKEHHLIYRDAYKEMCKQFIPNIEQPTKLLIIESLLEGAESWPYPYALCIMKMQNGELDEAQKWIDMLRTRFPLSWDEMAKEPLLRYFKLAQTDPTQLHRELNIIRETNLTALTAEKATEPRIARLILKDGI